MIRAINFVSSWTKSLFFFAWNISGKIFFLEQPQTFLSLFSIGFGIFFFFWKIHFENFQKLPSPVWARKFIFSNKKYILDILAYRPFFSENIVKKCERYLIFLNVTVLCHTIIENGIEKYFNYWWKTKNKIFKKHLQYTSDSR
jgi:hypothetical protein